MTQQHRPGVFGGVDTHKHTHVAAAVDGAGRVLGTAAFGADAAGYAELLGWLRGCGSVERVGVEGTGSYGAGLARCLAQAGVDVVDVNRPNRQLRRRGKTDTVDAQAAALAALSGSAAVVPKSADGCVEAIRVLSVARRSAVKARTVAANQIGAVVVTAPEQVKDRLRALNTARTVEACARMRPGAGCDPALAAAKQALRCLARRHQALTAEIKHLDTELRRLCERANPALLSACGVGAETAASLLVAAGDNPERMHSEASFAALCGTSPVEASSGRTVRHRLNRGHNRRANNALWRIAMVRLRFDERSIAYAARLTAQGKTRREILRCLKRHIAREVYKPITDPPDVVHGADLRRQRTQRRLDEGTSNGSSNVRTETGRYPQALGDTDDSQNPTSEALSGTADTGRHQVLAACKQQVAGSTPVSGSRKQAGQRVFFAIKRARKTCPQTDLLTYGPARGGIERVEPGLYGSSSTLASDDVGG